MSKTTPEDPGLSDQEKQLIMAFAHMLKEHYRPLRIVKPRIRIILE